jgi:hypothetical protein
MIRSLERCVVAAVFAALLIAGSRAADAIEITCIEGSRYKHLYRIFGDDRQKMADYLQIDAGRLPDGDKCRAILVTGRIFSDAEAKKLERPVDSEKLLAAITQNEGWLATLYLASGGGNVRQALGLGRITRMFWLKVRAPAQDRFIYRPDFFAADGSSAFGAEPEVPAEYNAGLKSYLEALGADAELSISALNPEQKHSRCASACTYLHTAGIDRVGKVFVHRGRPGPGDQRTMSEALEGLQRSESAVLAHYRMMDVGADFINRYLHTPTATLSAASTDRFPRYVWDFLYGRCRTTFQPSQGSSVENSRMRQAWPAPVEQCIAALHERERLSLFGKNCAQPCSYEGLKPQLAAYIRQLNDPVLQQPPPRPATQQ